MASSPSAGNRELPGPLLVAAVLGRVADIAAYEARVASIPTWPFDLSTLVRFALYVALGLASWLGAAVIERFVDVVLG